MFIIIEDVDIISSRSTNTTIPPTAPVLLVYMLITIVSALCNYKMIIECI